MNRNNLPDIAAKIGVGLLWLLLIAAIFSGLYLLTQTQMFRNIMPTGWHGIMTMEAPYEQSTTTKIPKPPRFLSISSQ